MKFLKELYVLVNELEIDGELFKQNIIKKLEKLWERKIIKSNHTIMEVILAYYLYKKGYEIDVEHELENGLVCNIFTKKENKIEIVEIETGFVHPPIH